MKELFVKSWFLIQDKFWLSNTVNVSKASDILSYYFRALARDFPFGAERHQFELGKGLRHSHIFRSLV